MASEIRFHTQSAPDYHKHLLKRARAINNLSDGDADLIQAFITQAQATRGIGGLRCTKLAQTLTSWKKYLKVEWDKATIHDLHVAINELNSSGYKRNTRHDHIRILKYFYSWLIKKKLSAISRDDLAEIKPPAVDRETTEAKDLLDREDLKKIISACKNLRDKAIIATLFESAARISEIARARWGDLEYHDAGVIELTIYDEKTKQKRSAPLLMASEYLAAWRSGYPGLPNEDALLFVDSQGNGMQYRAIAFQITRAAKRAGIEKRCNPHVFRKSRLTEMVREGYQESVIKKIGWNNEGTAMIKTYIRLGSDDVLKEFMMKSGIKQKEEQQRNNLPKQCSYCFAMNSTFSEYCHKCGQPLTDEARDKLKSATEAERADPLYQHLMAVMRTEVEKIVKAGGSLPP